MSRILTCLFCLIAVVFVAPLESHARGRHYASWGNNCPGGVCNLPQRSAVSTTTKTKAVQKQQSVTTSAAVNAPAPPSAESTVANAPTPINKPVQSPAVSKPVTKSAVSVQNQTSSRQSRSERHGRHKERRRQSSVSYY